MTAEVIFVEADGQLVCQGCGQPVTEELGTPAVMHHMPCPEVEKLISGGAK